MADLPRVTAVVLGYGDQPLLEDAVDALLASDGVDLDVVLVDNGCTDGAVDRLASRPQVTVARPGRNLGFAGGSDYGADRAGGDLFAFVNADAVAAPTAMAHLAAALDQPGVGIASASLRLADDPSRLNSAGNEVHFLGFCWCGGLGRPATEFAVEREVTAATGAAMMMRRRTWDELGGFEPTYFAYHEDTDLSLRCWQHGQSVVYVPDAEVIHDYEFNRSHTKRYLVERNRLITVFTTFEARTLLLVLPFLVATEAAILALAVREGWAGDKARGWWWLLRNVGWLRRRRRAVQAARRRPDAELFPRLAPRISANYVPLPRVARPFDRLFGVYWGAVTRRATVTNSL